MQEVEQTKEITISHNNRRITFRTNKNGNINLKFLKQYFPRAGGLLYLDSMGNTRGLNLLGDEIILNADVHEYEVHIPSVDDVKTSMAGQSRLKDILEKIRKPIDVPVTTDSYQTTNKLKRAPLIMDKTININIGWMHKKIHDAKFQLVREPFGGTKQLQLRKNHLYNCSEVIELAIDEFKKTGHWITKNNVLIYLGNNDSDIIEEFRKDNGDRCGFWEFFKMKNIPPCRIKLYLLSEELITDADGPQPVNRGASTSALAAIKRPFKQAGPLDVPPKKPKKTLTFADIRNVTAVAELNQQIKQTFSRSTDASNLASSSSKRVNPKNKFTPKADAPICIEQKSIRSSNVPIMSTSRQIISTPGKLPMIIMEENDAVPQCGSNNIGFKEVGAASQEYPRNSEPSGSSDTQTVKIVDDVLVYYHKITVSQYSGQPSIIELTKPDLFAAVDCDDPGRFDYSSFDPVTFGYPISRIVKEDKVLLQVLVNNDMSKEYKFPSEDSAEQIAEHQLLYDANNLYGYCCGKFGFGAIPSCQESCSPMISWYRNNQLVRSAVRLYWLDQEIALDGSTWHCEVDCAPNHQLTANEDNTHMDSDVQEGWVNAAEDLGMPPNPEPPFPGEKRSEVEVLEDQEILKTANQKLSITDTLLGAGSQSKVYKGKYGSTDVAIKTIKFPGSMVQLKDNEIYQMRAINHVNIMQIMDVVKTGRFLHIVMPLFTSDALVDIIFMPNIKKKYQFTTTDKNNIANQVCQALDYLHLQEPPMVHGDLKPDNILVNQQGLVKLSDLTFRNLSRTTDIVGDIVTPLVSMESLMYMAPELLIRASGNKKTVYSDIWALGCTFVEMYSEQEVWNLDGHDPATILRNLLRENASPDLTSIPEILRELVDRCFEAEPKQRPSASDIQSLYTLIN